MRCGRVRMELVLACGVSVMWNSLAMAIPQGQSPVQGSTEIRSGAAIPFDRAALFDEVVDRVERDFYNQAALGNEWQSAVAESRAQLDKLQTHDEFSAMMNDLLNGLNSSHTAYFSRLDPRSYQLYGVFQRMFPDEEDTFFQYDGLGLLTKRDDGGFWVTSVLDGSPASQMKLRYGDRLIAVDNEAFHPILSFAGKAGGNVAVHIKRNGEPMVLQGTVARLDGRQMFMDAMLASMKVIDKDGLKLGYIHVWSYAAQAYQEAIKEALLWGKLRDCDGLVFDIRDGWGGASPEYLNLFREPIMTTYSTQRDGTKQSYSGVWGKPVVLLVNGQSTSGKELFAYGFKKLQLGKLVGETTAGAVLAGTAVRLSNDDLMYLAVRDVMVDDGRLEGKGVVPDVKVPRLGEASHAENVPNHDAQFEAAIEILMRDLQDR